MVGVIRTRHVLMHPILISREFGVRCFTRCVWRSLTSHHAVTFLECIQDPSREHHS